jgi:hypothetical protein
MDANSVEPRWKEICEQLMTEHNPEQFEKLMGELFLLLEQRQNELRGTSAAAD